MKLLYTFICVMLLTLISNTETNAQPPNIYANPFCLGITSDLYELPMGDTMEVLWALGNDGASPIPAGGAEWNILFPKWAKVDTNSLDFDTPLPIFEAEWTIDPDSTTHLTIHVVGAGITADSFPPVNQQTFNQTVNVIGQALGGPDQMYFTCQANTTISQDLNPGDNIAWSPYLVVPQTSFPLDFISINVSWLEDQAGLVEWVVANEKNNEKFEVERSEDAINFSKVGEVASIGDHTEEHTYSYTDAGLGLLEANTFYYRVKQLDYDGKSTYSEVFKLTKDLSKAEEREITVYPNPVFTDNLSMKYISPVSFDKEQRINIINVNGQIVQSEYVDIKAGENMYKFDISELTTGVYTVIFTETKPDTGVETVEAISFTKF